VVEGNKAILFYSIPVKKIGQFYVKMVEVIPVFICTYLGPIIALKGVKYVA